VCVSVCVSVCVCPISFLFVMFASLPRSFFGLVRLVLLARAYNTLPNVCYYHLDRFSLIFINLFRVYNRPTYLMFVIIIWIVFH